ncbi:hypothetical protein [Neisseria yangbaofengii]|uniref:hypothetical protein n=1 Tax=Neisseria yangbaofengii TaxID=2709396 RepID=UPI0013EA2432|nr:hypothetical protein [Neisseria yangbaofengii]
MKLTLAIPSLNRRNDETLPPLRLDAFNQILRYGLLNKTPQTPSEFYRRHLWQGSLSAQAKRMLNIPANQAAAFASPLWQQMGMHQARVISGEHLNIQTEEAGQLCRELSDFYRKDGWQFHTLRPDLWLITMPSEIDWQVAPIWDIGGQIGATDQASGRDALQWLNKQTEIQMWLHNHPLNRQRQNRQAPALNGLWLWQDIHGSCTHTGLLASDSPWAAFYPHRRIDAPYDFDAYLNATNESGLSVSDGLIFLDDLAVTEQTGDVSAYQEILQSWENRWFAPLWQALQSGRLKQLTIAADGENGGKLVITPKAKWAFWKAKKNFNGIW